jgi:hypothetical protein
VSLFNLKNLTSDIYNQIPLSIRLKADEIEFNDLPLEVQFLISNSLQEKQYPSNIQTNKIYDLAPRLTIYNDLKPFETTKELIVEYIRNYLLISKGAYPFDPIFGNELKKHLQTKDTQLRSLLVGNELNNIVKNITQYFKINVELIDYGVTKNSGSLSQTELFLNIRLKINGEIYNMEVV